MFWRETIFDVCYSRGSEKQKGLKRETLNNGGKSEYTWWKSSKEENLKTLYRIYLWRIKVVQITKEGNERRILI